MLLKKLSELMVILLPVYFSFYAIVILSRKTMRDFFLKVKVENAHFLFPSFKIYVPDLVEQGRTKKLFSDFLNLNSFHEL